MKSKIAIVTLLVWSLNVMVFANTPIEQASDAVRHFDQVDENLYRGGQPDLEGFEKLKAMGIKKVINFRAEEGLHLQEKKQVESLGFEYVQIPWTIYGAYKKQAAIDFLEAIKDRDANPVFFHCRRGSERTGVMAAVYNMKEKGLSYREALKDAERFHLKFMWKGFVKKKMKRYEKDLVG